MVRVIPYKGTVIALLDFQDIQQMIYLRAAVESAVLRDFLPLCTPLLEEKIRYQIRKQVILVQGDFEIAQFYEMDSRLHSIWFHETDKKKIWKWIQKAQIHYTRFRMLDIAEAQDFETIIQEHQGLLERICAKDAGAMEELVNRHLYGGIHRLEKRIRTDFQKYFIQ